MAAIVLYYYIYMYIVFGVQCFAQGQLGIEPSTKVCIYDPIKYPKNMCKVDKDVFLIP